MTRTPSSPEQVRDKWKRVNTIARRAGSDDTSSDSDTATASQEQRMKLKESKSRQKKEREEYAKVMGTYSNDCKSSPYID